MKPTMAAGQQDAAEEDEKLAETFHVYSSWKSGFLYPFSAWRGMPV